MQPITPNMNKDANQMDKSLLCLGENQESVDALFADSFIAQALSDPLIANNIITLHITDQKLYNNFDLMLKV